MRDILVLITVVSIFMGALYKSVSDRSLRSTDSYIRDSVVLLTSPEGSCTGVEVKAESGKIYTLTAAHCKALIIKDRILATTEDGTAVSLKVLQIDDHHDLMLLEGIKGRSVNIASEVYSHQQIRTITHGGHFPSFKTIGELLEERTLHVHGSYITSQEDMNNCPVDEYSKPMFDMYGIYCERTETVMVTTAFVIPGSSGGPALDASGNLVGIVSCSDDMFSGLIPLHDIQQFLAGK